MRELFVEKVIDCAGEFLDNNQRIKLKEILTEICLNYHIEILEQNQKQEIQKNNEEILNKFISSKEIEGCSVRTLKYYKDNITKMLDTVNLPINKITTEKLRNYLSNYKMDEQFKNQVLHMIGSHMNEYSEWGALVLPKMLEVIIINYADSMDAYFEPAHNIIKNANPGELYKVGNAPRPYYKSLNVYYNKLEDKR